MDSMFIWMLVFAGATIGLLAVFLIASERELRTKRREIETLANKLASSTESGPSDRTGFREQTDNYTTSQPETDNKQLHDEIEALQKRLEERETRVQELDAKVRGFTNLLAENDQLDKRNEELLDEITALKNKLQGSQSHEDLEQGQHKALEERCAALESAFTEAKAELKESQSCLQELQSTKAQLEAADSRAREATDRCADLEKRTGDLMEQLAANQERLTRYDSLQSQLHDVEQRYEQVRSESQRFQEEISRYQERFAASSDAKQRLAALRQHLDELHTQQVELAEKHGDLRQGMLALTKLLDEALQDRFDSGVRTTAYESSSLQVSLPLMSHSDKPPLEEVKKRIEGGAYEEALHQLKQLLKDAPENRDIKLYQLLASVRLYGVEGYEKQIDAIAEMVDLNDSERIIARDILLVRAEDAQRRGRDDDMLRYRAWAKNVTYRMPFGAPEHDSPSPTDDARPDSSLASGGETDTSGHTDLSTVAVSDTSNGKDSGESANGKTRAIIVAGVIGLLVVVGVMFSGFFEEPGTAPIPPSGGAQKSGASRISETNGDNAPLSTNPPAVKDESPTVRVAPKSEPSQSRLSGDARANRPKNADTTPLASNKSRGNASAVKETREQNKQREQTPVSLAGGLGDTYEVVRPTQVLSEPRPGSTLIANLDRGTRVNVVAARDGWFEIRSKYGRPPGFIPRETAVRIQQN